MPLPVEILEERNQSVTPVFITIDPARDTPKVVGEFAEAMHPRMIGLTGLPEQVRTASQAYRTYYQTHEPVDGEYLVDHSTFSYLGDARDRFCGLLPPGGAARAAGKPRSDVLSTRCEGLTIVALRLYGHLGSVEKGSGMSDLQEHVGFGPDKSSAAG